MKEKTLGEVARNAFAWATGPKVADDWDAVAAAVIAEHERRKWRSIETLPACGMWIIAGYRDGDEWICTLGAYDLLRTFPEYTHWQYAPEGPK